MTIIGFLSNVDNIFNNAIGWDGRKRIATIPYVDYLITAISMQDL